MSFPSKFLLSLLTLSILFTSTTSKNCSTYVFSSNQTFASCTDLPYLSASLHWIRSHSSAVCVAFKAPQSPTGWIAWGINPNSTSMLGTQALIAFRHSNGSMVAYPTALTSYTPTLKPTKLSFLVHDVSAEYVEGEMIVFATLGVIGGGKGAGGLQFNHVWQEGSSVADDVPAMHSTIGDNVLAKGTIEFH